MSQAAPAAAPATGASAPGASLLPDGTGTITSVHFIVLALFAALVIAAIVYGIRLKRRRTAARHDIAAHNETLPDEPASASIPSPAPSGDRSAAEGPVTQLKGLGPKLADQLAALGITTVGQLAALSDDEAQALDGKLGAFSGRLARDRWLEQARFLAAGDRAGFEAVFGRL